ncbi:MAG: hypothetical protein OXH90_09965 [Paracoccaceae bacterium]|nr:hypothetical protein [Paracoccaceae bacterium]
MSMTIFVMASLNSLPIYLPWAVTTSSSTVTPIKNFSFKFGVPSFPSHTPPTQ